MFLKISLLEHTWNLLTVKQKCSFFKDEPKSEVYLILNKLMAKCMPSDNVPLVVDFLVFIIHSSENLYISKKC